MEHQDQRSDVTVLVANTTNNAKGGAARHRRWAPARDAAWDLLDGWVAPGARVAVVGAGNGDDVPLARLARRAGALDLIDLDRAALRRARRRAQGGGLRRGGRGGAAVRALAEDVTGGAADAIVAAGSARAGARARGTVTPAVCADAVGDGPYDVVVCDLLLTQLLYPALRRTGLDGRAVDDVLLRDGQGLTDAVVARLHAAAPGGTVVILHDLLGWWDGHAQPFGLEELLARGAEDPAAAVALAARGSLPYGCDPWTATRRAGAEVAETRLWRWPFAAGADYAVFGLVTRRP
ncbi:MAG: hypothetical protein QOF26_4204 [Baekduia sp.]|jgi:hypothetical protein|nr:hypothetical protein [Baekduia sp.]